MDSSSWIDGYTANSTGVGGNGGFMCGYTASRFPSASLCREDEEQQHELLLNAQIQQHLNQISMHMSADDVEPAAYGGAIHSVDFLPNSLHDAGASSFPSSSSASSSLHSASLSCSPEISSTAAHVLAAPSTTVQFPEVSSFLCDDFTDTPEEMAPGVMSTSASAFRRYERHLGPRRKLTKPACGQRMFKTAMSVVGKMHTAMRYRQQQQQEQYCYQQQQQQASGNQLQHMISERKRREKLNDSFHALRTVLPPGSKKDKTSILIIAREYVTSLKSKVCELEEKNQALQALLARGPTSGVGAEEDKKVEIQITAAGGDQNGEVCTVKIAARPARGNTTDVVLRTLQCLKNQIGEDVSLLSMSTDQAGDGPHGASLTLHLKVSGAKWEEEAVREAVTKAVTTPVPAGLGGAE
ncbi:putative transcription factor bHLH041 [Lolium rigidum]|uniref:putative transcription factor bHLH041 n=1 Tax=Lolium rigidum TaxID=89674 RepID=UPI001F5CC1DF|nr:putative transcription factor bHLH041 [Lolium rigidum]